MPKSTRKTKKKKSQKRTTTRKKLKKGKNGKGGLSLGGKVAIGTLVPAGLTGAAALTWIQLHYTFKKCEAFNIRKNAQDVRLLTLNAFMRPPLPFWLQHNGNDRKNVRLYHLTKIIQNFDYVSLQEAFAKFNGRQQYIVDCAKQAGLKYSVTSPGSSLFTSDGGLVILSRDKIISSKFVKFTKCYSDDKLAEKGILMADVVRNGKVFTIVNTHLQAIYDFNDKENIEARDCQIETLASHVVKIQNPVILTGDFNLNARKEHIDPDSDSGPSDEYKSLMNKLVGFTDAVLESHKFHPPTTGFVRNGVVEDKKLFPSEYHTKQEFHNETLDYILLNGVSNKGTSIEHFPMIDDEGNFMHNVSDHGGVAVTIAFE
jgi:endonuclease/exonuclease/phosphatase family metal-dependent hydrolase